LTLVVSKQESVPEIVTAGLDTVALRIPAHPAALALIRSAGRAIAAPSANYFGAVSPTEANHVVEQLGDKVDLILDGGKCSVGLESTILSLTGTTPTILRAGGISLEELEKVLGRVDQCTQSSETPRAPGQLTRHYATRTPLKILKNSSDAEPNGLGARVGLVSLTTPRHPELYTAVEVLSPSGDLREAASNLFSALHRLDSLKLDLLVAHPVQETGLGTAIMDRLRRCSAAAGISQPQRR
jgi:L-threonylcarbamoyladenylate synthase